MLTHFILAVWQCVSTSSNRKGGDMKDIAYIDHCNGRFEMFTYSDGDRVYIRNFYTGEGINAYAVKHNYKLIWIN